MHQVFTPVIMKKLILALILAMPIVVHAQTRLVSHRVKTNDGRTFTLNAPADFEIVPAAEGFKRVRFFSRSPDGRIFVTDMYNLADNKRGAIYILDAFDERTGKFGKVISYMTGLHNPNSLQFYRDSNGQDWIYIAETGQLTRRRFTRGEEKPTDRSPQVIATFPDHGLDYKYGGWHLTRTLAFGTNGKLYVSVGSSCNSCEEKEDVRATVLEMDPDGSGRRIIAKGLRNAVGLKWINGALWATNQGSDHLGAKEPDETFYRLPTGDSKPADHGWPYCHSSNGRIFADPKLQRRGGCRGVVAPDAFFPARSSALGFDYFGVDSFAPMRDAFLVALHGSTNKDIGSGYKIVAWRAGQRPRDVITGFLRRGKVNGRPCDIIKLKDDSFLFSDDNKGVIYLVRRRR